MLGATRQQFSPADLLTKPKSNRLPTATPIQQPSLTPTDAASQATSATNWKTYRNKKVGFEIKYPPNYNMPYIPKQGGLGGSKNVDGSEDNTAISFDEPSTHESNGNRFILILYPYTSTLDELVKDAPTSPYFDYDHPTQKLKELTIDGKPGYWFITTTDEGEESDMEIFFVGKNHGFILQAGLTHDRHEVEQILSTFRFIY